MTGVNVNDLIRFVAEPSKCSYLPNKTAQLEYRVPANLTSEAFGELLRRGWRRFGNYVFRPRCTSCSECRSIRVPVSDFRPSKSQRRTLRRNEHIEAFVGPPSITDEHIELFNAYHRDMTDRRDWPENTTSFQDYFESFIGRRYDFAREITYFDGDRLVGVGLVDVVDNAMSSAYFYHDPAWRKLGPGTFSALTEIEFARQSGLSHVYLGFWIRENQSMTYKARFRPHELLEGQVEEDAEPDWRLAEEPVAFEV
jgi:leucyl-tRNA---protein transferase